MVVSTDEIRGTGKRHILYGWLHTLDSGEKIYMARRRHKDIFRCGKETISGAMTEGVASWAIDEDLLVRMRARGVKFIGVKEIDTGDSYIAPVRTWFNPKTSRLRDYTGIGRGGSRQRYVPFQFLTIKRACVTLDDDALY